MKEIDELQSEIEKIKERNKKVEADKAWETSWMRRVFIAIVTYALIVVLLISISASEPFVTAVIPAVAYLLSTVSLGIVKEWWLKSKRDSKSSSE